MKKFILIAICVMFVASLAYAGDYTYVGVKKCKMCHKGEKKGKVFEKWAAGPHAGAFETLKKGGNETKAECLECHVTAFNKGGYKVGDANAAKFEGVQCEVCHGPGSAYKKMSVMKDHQKSIDNGMIVPTEEACKKCHNKKSPDFKGFNYKEYLKKIDHTYSK
jgi:Cytochrome c554 and c-prime